MENKVNFVLLITLTFLLFGITSANASTQTENCRFVKGNIQEFQTSDAGQPLATRGDVTGSLVGRFVFKQVGDLVPLPVAGVFFVEGDSFIRTAEGRLNFIELITIDTKRPGNFSDLWIITGGRRGYQRAHGEIHFFGNFDLTLGIGNGTYKGTVCVPL